MESREIQFTVSFQPFSLCEEKQLPNHLEKLNSNESKNNLTKLIAKTKHPQSPKRFVY